MANPFYARYIPPPTSSNPTLGSERARDKHDSGEQELDTTKKRKRTQVQSVDRKRRRSEGTGSTTTHQNGDVHVNSFDRRTAQPSDARDVTSNAKTKDRHKRRKPHFDDSGVDPEHVNGNDIVNRKSKKELERHSTSQKAEAGAEATEVVANGDGVQNGHNTGQKSEPKKRKRHKKNSEGTEGDESQALTGEQNAEESQKHSGIMSKFKKSTELQKEAHPDEEYATGGDVDAEEIVEINELVPIPQPESDPNINARPTYETLPRWLSRPTTISSDLSAPFESLGVSSDICARMKSKGYPDALAVQAGVLPSLLPIPSQHPGDVCVSAATGSGKTLAYMIPIVESLRNRFITALRAVVVVPTRELVSQAREVALMCASSTELKIGTAVGSQSLESEQDALIDKQPRYDPDAHQTMRARWRRMFEGEEDDDESDYGDAGFSDEFFNAPDGWVFDYTSQVDILICTPGRLVDHINSTRGFTLSNLEWLVIDEADRLLDQSFQEWTSVLKSAIEKRVVEEPASLGDCEAIMPKRARIDDIPQVRKVILSATMTRDLDKLASLKLRNPRLIIVGNANEKPDEDAEPTMNGNNPGTLTLPRTLVEHAVSVGDGSDKPLHLLQLLSKLLAPQNGCEKHDSGTSASSVSEDSSDETSSDSEGSIGSNDQDPSLQTRIGVNVKIKKDQKTSTTPLESNALVFASSNESALRLQNLLSHMQPNLSSGTASLTKSTSKKETQSIISRFTSSSTRKSSLASKQKPLSIIIATDRASRGLDLPDLGNVINYDIPHSVNGYVHRIGRTARAGRKGDAWTLLEDREAAWFWNVIGKGVGKDRQVVDQKIDRGAGGILRERLGDVGGGGRKEAYVKALKMLKEDVRGSRR
ncbi:MAG: ATP-dependent RNA helicase dbp6 [Chrysothrix sp. TS-e1954]|nr:MAG: ATP-dependent RNA helicase dbp6 [Chrysothrix sp. TS-e1954]